MAAAKAEGKPVMIDFTGHGCVNCRKMEAAVWTDPTVASLINDKFILVSLYVDDKTPLAEPITVSENGKDVTLRTIGDKWSFLQRHKFGANTQPFYIVVGHDGNDLSNIKRYYDRGVNYITLCHSYDNQICNSSTHTSDENKGLTEFGIKVVKEMNRVGMVIDLSHASMGTFWDVMKYSKKPVICSHSGAKGVYFHNRNRLDASP